MTLEAFQSGLSWITILRKREAFRAAFDGFAIDKVAAFAEADATRLMADAGIVRNRMKIDAALHNARVAADLPDGLAALLWSYRAGARGHVRPPGPRCRPPRRSRPRWPRSSRSAASGSSARRRRTR